MLLPGSRHLMMGLGALEGASLLPETWSTSRYDEQPMTLPGINMKRTVSGAPQGLGFHKVLRVEPQNLKHETLNLRP